MISLPLSQYGSLVGHQHVRELVYAELCEQIYLVISHIVHSLPWILPDPHRVTLFEIVRFSLFDEEEANLVFLQDFLQDLSQWG